MSKYYEVTIFSLIIQNIFCKSIEQLSVDKLVSSTDFLNYVRLQSSVFFIEIDFFLSVIKTIIQTMFLPH